jgi:hypothetical protein
MIPVSLKINNSDVQFELFYKLLTIIAIRRKTSEILVFGRTDRFYWLSEIVMLTYLFGFVFIDEQLAARQAEQNC